MTTKFIVTLHDLEFTGKHAMSIEMAYQELYDDIHECKYNDAFWTMKTDDGYIFINPDQIQTISVTEDKPNEKT